MILAFQLYIQLGTIRERGGGQVVNVIAFYSKKPSLNPAEVYNFLLKLMLKRTKINK